VFFSVAPRFFIFCFSVVFLKVSQKQVFLFSIIFFVCPFERIEDKFLCTYFASIPARILRQFIFGPNVNSFLCTLFWSGQAAFQTFAKVTSFYVLAISATLAEFLLALADNFSAVNADKSSFTYAQR